jgi:hypothetical protein
MAYHSKINTSLTKKISRVKVFVQLKSSVFWDITPYSPFKTNQRFGEICRLHLHSRSISHAGNEGENSWQAERYTSEDRAHHNHRCKNLKSCMFIFFIMKSQMECKSILNLTVLCLFSVLNFPEKLHETNH